MRKVDGFEITLNSPLTEEQWDAIVDVDFEHTDRIWFHTKHGKEVEFVKRKKDAQSEIIRCKDCRWGKEVCGNIECFADTNVPPEYHGYEWFCPNGERRTDG